jgi:hypothetical protein
MRLVSIVSLERLPDLIPAWRFLKLVVLLPIFIPNSRPFVIPNSAPYRHPELVSGQQATAAHHVKLLISIVSPELLCPRNSWVSPGLLGR